MNRIYTYPSPFGPISIAENDQAITHLLLPGDAYSAEYETKESELLREASRQLQAYFAGNLRKFDLPLAPAGTDFMKRVWDSLQRIPYGATRSYRDIALDIGNPKACRAVGQANNRNPLPIFIPCHRVIGANGNLIGYGGGLPIKQYLINLESSCLARECPGYYKK